MTAQSRLAIGVLASAAPNVLQRVLNFWNTHQCTVYIHVDTKLALQEFEYVASYSFARLITQRHEVSWGGFSLVDAELSLIRAAIAEGFDYFLLVSDDSVPLRSVPEIRQALEDKTSWRRLEPIDFTDFREISERYLKFYCADISAGNPRNRTMHFDPQDADELLELQTLMRTGKFPLTQMHWCANWKVLSWHDANFVISQVELRDRIFNSFKYSLNPDEHYIPTLLGRRLEGFDYIPNFMWADFTKEPKPYVIRDMLDIHQAIDYGCLFARKIRDPGLASEVIDAVKNNHNSPKRQ